MKIYTLTALISVPVVLLVDRVFKTNLYKNRLFWVFHLVIVILTTIVDSYSAARPIVIYNEAEILGVRFFEIPLENYLFGFSLITLNLIFFEKHINNK